jgi:two-component system response regulator MtrA
MRILIAEDNRDMAFGLMQALETGGYDPELTTDGATALERARATPPPALIILDLMLPGVSGYRVLRALREEGNRTPVIILSARAEETDKVQGFRLGADDYVTKPFGVLELLARVEAVLRRAAMAPAQRAEPTPAPLPTYRFGGVVVDAATREVRREGKLVALTPLEFDLLLALLRRDGAAAARGELLREVWGYEADVVSRTVDTHVLTLREKLEEDPAAPQYILTVRKVGYRLRR